MILQTLLNTQAPFEKSNLGIFFLPKTKYENETSRF